MFKLSLALASLLIILLLDSLAIQSSVLSVCDFAGVYVLLVWFNFSRRSEEGSWVVCLVISIVFGIFRQHNLAELILGLTVALLVANLFLRFSPRQIDYHLIMVLIFFSFLALISQVLGNHADFLRVLIYIIFNSVMAYGIQLVVMRHADNNSRNSYKYK